MLNPECLSEFFESLNFNMDEILGDLSALAYNQCQLKIKHILQHILNTHNILKQEGIEAIKKIKFINMYNQNVDNRKENIPELDNKSQNQYNHLKKTHQKIVQRLDDRDDQKNDYFEDQEIFKSLDIKNKTLENSDQITYEEVKTIIDAKCILEKDLNPASKFQKSRKQLRLQFEIQNKKQNEKIEEQISTDQDFIIFQRGKMKDLISEIDKPQENQTQIVSKQFQMVNDHLLMKNQIKNENIKKMKQDLGYIQKIEKLYNLQKGQLEKDIIVLNTQQQKKSIQKSILQDERQNNNEICTRISTIQTRASEIRKEQIEEQRKKIREIQTQELFFKSMHQWTNQNPRQRQPKSAQHNKVPNINELKAYF